MAHSMAPELELASPKPPLLLPSPAVETGELVVEEVEEVAASPSRRPVSRSRSRSPSSCSPDPSPSCLLLLLAVPLVPHRLNRACSLPKPVMVDWQIRITADEGKPQIKGNVYICMIIVLSLTCGSVIISIIRAADVAAAIVVAAASASDAHHSDIAGAHVTANANKLRE